MFAVLGINDDVTTCECCGRSGLKRTVVLSSESTGIVHYGTDCAASAVYGSKTRQNRDKAENVARAVSYARKWMATRPVELIANAIDVRWCPAHVENGTLFVSGKGVA